MSGYIKELKTSGEEAGVCYITLNRPEVHNAFNDEMIAALTEEFLGLESDDSVRVVVLTGEGKSFCAGADLNWMKRMKDYSMEENIADSKKLAGLFHAINNLSKPVIGKVNGAALGGGVGLVACCDFVIASESAKFGLTEVNLGLVPAVITPFVIAKIGESNARHLFLTGERFDGKRALEIGLVHQVSLDRYYDADIVHMAKQLIKVAPKAQREAKKLIFGVKERLGNTEEVTDYTCNVIAKQRISDEGQEGMSALLEKRKPNWK
ncbi:enoyl-CoA hydratase-related protein [Halobacteriovorax sp.]|uniref:enoyl-CoA hydratase-related protein n=1 Tax=Halobacteriovorax sp. TaxID=2020862 RepID=UPI003AF2DA95